MKKKKIKGKAYNHRKFTRKRGILIAVSLYLAVIILAVGFVVFLPYFRNKSSLLELAKTRGEYTITHFTRPSEPDLRTEYYMFNEYGAIVTSDRSYYTAYDIDDLKQLVPQLLAQNTYYKFNILNRNSTGQRMAIIAGKCVSSESGRRFVSFIIRDMSDAPVTIGIFIGLFTLLYLFGGILIISIVKQHNDLFILQRDLISNVSHELKTPITSIKAMGEMIYDEMYRTDDDLKRYSGTILLEADKLNRLVREILNLAQLQSHKASFNNAVCYADGVFSPVIDHYMMMCSDLGIEMDVSGLALKSIPPLYTDPDQMLKVWQIILDNALKFAGKGGKVTVSQKLSNDRVTFCISDNGPGIAEKDINRVFERFYKADETHNSQGSGLGLAIAYEIIRNLKEKIWVESTEGEGAYFFFTISFK